MKRIIGITLTAGILGACAPLTMEQWASSRAHIPVGATVMVNEALPIRSGHTRVFMQDGRVVPKGGVNMYHPHCNFEVNTLSDGSARIEPGRFLVTRHRQGHVEVVQERGPMRVASLVQVSDDDDGSAPPISRLVHYELQSDDQTDVRRLTCHGGFADDWEAQYPTLAEMHTVLGGLVSWEE
ncbi:hypothetical protein [Thioalkalivibrio thiocyanodenitrificans]|uniref:hypothetical protein n=1 Tax=Thioalkalivibrio thiocyanodenitrificans TaxID=243063 RepID=UPI000367C95E|nr:hypothetical protein [Thioalkalivibrio thiocyanodenitrificans]